jgi:nitroimidazol reductase NimA-like FMN-containing flavoprotein (pyridoxamine 5'-phosphate oxidase superfamily)
VDRSVVEGELEQDGARDLLENATLLRLAYNGLDGLPRVIPIGFFWNGTGIVMCTAVTAPKVRALAARPGVALTIDVGSSPSEARSLLIRGVAEIEIVPGVAEEYLAASRKTLDATQFAGFKEAVTGMYPEMARISVTPTWARFYDFGAGRLPRFLRELAESD